MHACASAVFFLLQTDSTEAAIAGDGKPCAASPAHTQFAARGGAKSVQSVCHRLEACT